MTDISNTNTKIYKAMFIDMLMRYWAWRRSKGTEPRFMYTKPNQQGDTINIKRFNEMRTRYELWEQSHGSPPNYVNTIVTTPSNKSAYIQSFENAVGRSVNSFTEAYNSIKGRSYSYYYNDIYSQSAALQRLKNRSGLNCSDICQLMYQVAKDLGYSVRYVNIRCASGSGHIQLDIAGKELGSNWRRIDPAAALKSSYPLGQLWCASGANLIGYNQQWLLSDDGRT